MFSKSNEKTSNFSFLKQKPLSMTIHEYNHQLKYIINVCVHVCALITEPCAHILTIIQTYRNKSEDTTISLCS